MNIQKFAKHFGTMNFGRSTLLVASKRTPIGSFLGKLSNKTAPQLGGIAIKAAIDSIKLDPKTIEQVVMGSVCQGGIGQNPSRQAELAAGIPVSVPATTINKVCASGMKTAVYAAMAIGLGINDIVITGGMESMSNVPFYLHKHRKGHPYGNQELIDGIQLDLTDIYSGKLMGVCAEKTAADLKITRQQQDDYCISSYDRSAAATKNGFLAENIVPIKISDKETLKEDEEYKRLNKEKLLKLKPAFQKNGTVTAGNSSKINDAACSNIFMSEQKAKELNLKPLARIVSYADAGVDPVDFCIAPKKACDIALEKAGLNINQIDYHEINEAFAVTVLANIILQKLDPSKVNIYGGAVSLGHPIGFSGARLIQTLATVLKNNKAKYGMASICNGGGGATAVIIENLQL